VVNSDETMLIALGTLLIVALVIAVHRALSSEQYSLSAGDWWAKVPLV